TLLAAEDPEREIGVPCDRREEQRGIELDRTDLKHGRRVAGRGKDYFVSKVVSSRR
ncbi:MAG: hypothetical protein RLZZ238_285, partial [Planctomycetota bacterium]